MQERVYFKYITKIQTYLKKISISNFGSNRAFKSIGNSNLEAENSLINITRKHDIKKSSLPLLFQKNSIVSPKSKQLLVNIKSDHQTHGILRIVSQPRKAFFEFNSFFPRESYLYPIQFLKIESYGNVKQSWIY